MIFSFIQFPNVMYRRQDIESAGLSLPGRSRAVCILNAERLRSSATRVVNVLLDTTKHFYICIQLPL